MILRNYQALENVNVFIKIFIDSKCPENTFILNAR